MSSSPAFRSASHDSERRSDGRALTVAYTIYSIRLNAISQEVLVSLERTLNR